MPNIAAILKQEIARVARKEVRNEIEALKKAVSLQRSQIAALKREQQALERALRAAARRSAPAADTADAAEPARGLRFSPTRLAAQRRKLGLSAERFGRLIGASGQSVYLWERGNSRPNAENLAAIASLRGLGKRALAQRLASLD